MGNQASFSNQLSYRLIDNCVSKTQVSLTMADLRLVILGCLMLVAFAQSQQICERAQPGEILERCLSGRCPISTLDDIKKGLAKDLRNLKHKLGGNLVSMTDCVSTMEMTGQNTLYNGTVKGTGCCDDKMVEEK